MNDDQNIHLGNEQIPALGSYTVIRCIGTGEKEDTFLCQDPRRPGRKVVRKLFHEDFSAQNPDLVDLDFTHLSTVFHPYLAKILDFAWEDGKAYLVSEYVEGSPFHEAVGRATPEQILRFIGQLLIALDYLYSHNVLHLDLKPQNILVRQNPTTGDLDLKLVDYGLMPLLHPPSQIASDAIGTPPYTAPEYAVHRVPDVRGDLYSVGILLYAAMVRRLPFPGKTPAAILQEQLQGDPSPLHTVAQGISPKLSTYVQGLISRDPQSRPASPRAALQALVEATGTSFAKDKLAWPAPVTDPNEVFSHEEFLRLFRRITLQGGLWAISGKAGSGKSFLAGWLQRHFWLNQKQAVLLRGADIALLQGEQILNPAVPLYLIIDDADLGPVEAWLQVRPYLHVILLGRDLGWTKKDARWKSYELKASPRLQTEQAKNPFALLSDPARRLLSLLAFVQVPLTAHHLETWLGFSPEEIAAALEMLAKEEWVERSVRMGTEFFQSKISIPPKLDVSISAAQVRQWLVALYEEGYYEAALLALERYFSPEIHQDPDLLLLKAKLLRAAGRNPEVLALITAPFVNGLGDVQQGVAFETLGQSLLATDKAKPAEAAFRNALKQFQQVQDLEGQARVLTHLGRLSEGAGDRRLAVEFYQQAYAMADQAEPSTLLKGIIDLRVADFYVAATDFEKAEEKFQSCLQNLEQLEKGFYLAMAYRDYAAMSLNLEDLPRAEYFCREGLGLSILKRYRTLQGRFYLLWAKIEEQRNNPNGILERLSAAVFVLSKIPSSLFLVQAFVERAAFYESNRQWPLAMRDAEEALREARRIQNVNLEGQSHLVMGKILSRDVARLAKALEQFDLAAKNFAVTKNFQKGWECEFQVAEIERYRENISAARTHYENALQMLDRALIQVPPGTQEEAALSQGRMQVEMALNSLG